MKNFQDFINEIKNAVNFEGIVEQITVTKSNGRELTGLTFRKTKNSIAPTVYMNDYFEAYQNGTDIDDIVKKVEEILDMEVPDFDIGIALGIMATNLAWEIKLLVLEKRSQKW